MRTFADYMEQVLYGPAGYYSSGAARSGKTGDYFTAPDVGPVFGRLLYGIFRSWKERLRVDPFTLIEVGAGEGRLAEDILKAGPVHYIAVERSASRQATLKKIPGLEVYPDLGSMPPAEGVLFGNELVDAFPVHRVRMKNGKLEEMYVGAGLVPARKDNDRNPLDRNSSNTRAGTRPAPTIRWSSPSTPRLQSYFDRLGIALPEDYETEVNLAMADWLKGASGAIRKGLVVLIDYGRPAHDYYATERSAGTLRAFSRHQVMTPSPQALSLQGEGGRRPGEGIDLTADVDFTSLALDAREAGFTPLVFMEMGTFLMMGIDDQFRAGTRPAPTGLKYLLHPEGLGAAFHVLILGKNIDPAEWTFEHNRLRRLGLPV